jgi:hypothetical protein
MINMPSFAGKAVMRTNGEIIAGGLSSASVRVRKAFSEQPQEPFIFKSLLAQWS